MKQLAFIFLLLFSVILFADNMSPLGKWKTIDDATGIEKSIIKIWEKNGEIFGTIESLFLNPEEDPNPLCTECKGNLYNQPIIGMTILNNLKKNGNEWNGGTILDPNNGKTYKCKIEVVDGGARLKVRGFIGLSLLGRTQYWLRVE